MHLLSSMSVAMQKMQYTHWTSHRCYDHAVICTVGVIAWVLPTLTGLIGLQCRITSPLLFNDHCCCYRSSSLLDPPITPTVVLYSPINPIVALAPGLLHLISLFLGKNGWRVEMSRKSVGGRGRDAPGSESRCYDCGAPGHFARECRSRDSRRSHRRSPSPLSRSDRHRHSLSRSGRDRSRSPRRDRDSSYRDRPRKRERSSSVESDKSERRARLRRERERSRSISPQHGKSDVVSPLKKRERSKSPQNHLEKEENILDQSNQNAGSEAREISPEAKGNESSKSPTSEKSNMRDVREEDYELSKSPQCEGSDIERNQSPAAREYSRSPQPDNVNSYADGGSPLKNGSATSRSPREENNGSYEERSPAEVVEERQGDSE